MKSNLLIALTLLSLLRILLSTALNFNDTLPFVILSPLPRVFQSDSFFAEKKVVFTGESGKRIETNMRFGSLWPFLSRSPHSHFTAFKMLDRPYLFSETDWMNEVRRQFCGPQRLVKLNPEIEAINVIRIQLYYKTHPLLIRSSPFPGGETIRDVTCATQAE